MHIPHTPHQEPEEVFLPLSPVRYAEFYSAEMDGYGKDILFYKNNIPKHSKVLELGCGTGRICRNLSQHQRDVTGVDLSVDMLQLAKTQNETDVPYVCMDMCKLAFTETFDHIIIPYNTLNLLKTESQISKCLKQVYQLLTANGSLLFQIYLPHTNLLKKEKAEKYFQFQMLSLPDNNGKLIKESIRSFTPNTDTFFLQERYRVRPSGKEAVKEDLEHSFQLAGFSLKKWLTIIHRSRFTITSLFGNQSNRPFNKDTDTLLFAIITKQQ